VSVGLEVDMGLEPGVIGVAVGSEVLLQLTSVKISNTASELIKNLVMITFLMTQSIA
jgi:hypothetical protein